MQNNELKITVNNKNDPDYEVMFDALINEVFGFSFDIWFERKLWDEQYISYSIIDNGKMLANLCVYDNDMIIGGERFRAIQLGAVCTCESARKKGLSRQIMERVMSDYNDVPAFLFANESVLNYYPRFGFQQVQVYKPVLKAELADNIGTSKIFSAKRSVGMKKNLKLDVDDPIVINTLKNKSCFSNILDCINTESIQMFHLLKDYSDDIYYLPESDVIVVAYQEYNRLFIADVIASKPVSFKSIVSELPFNNIETIEFGFCPDWLDVIPKWEPVPMSDVMFFIKGEWNLPDVFRFPAMSET